MPIVDYIDSVTEEIFEVYIRSGEIPETVLNPETNNVSNRIYSGKIKPVFKGTGFYETDYKNK